MGFFTSNWPEIASFLVALAALTVALRVGWENRKYKAPAFRMKDGGKDVDGNPTLILVNSGETRAANVRLTFAMDPTRMLTGDSLNWDVIDKNEEVVITFTPNSNYLEKAKAGWLSELIGGDPERRRASVEYRTRLGKAHSEEVLTPSAQQLANAQVLEDLRESSTQ